MTAPPRIPSNTTSHLDTRYNPDSPQAEERSVTSQRVTSIRPYHHGGHAPQLTQLVPAHTPSLAYLDLYSANIAQHFACDAFDIPAAEEGSRERTYTPFFFPEEDIAS